jgi:hypothetical protein
VRRAVQRHPASEPVILTWIPGLPKFEHHDDRHEPTLIAAARSQMTASSPRGTFSQAELAAELVSRRLWVDEFADRLVVCNVVIAYCDVSSCEWAATGTGSARNRSREPPYRDRPDWALGLT